MPLLQPELLRDIDETTRGLGEIRRRLAAAGFKDVDELLALADRLREGIGSFAGGEVEELLGRVRATVVSLLEARSVFEELSRMKQAALRADRDLDPPV